MTKWIAALLTGLATLTHTLSQDERLGSEWHVVETLDIARVPADFPVRFCLLTTDQIQYVAYYDDQRRMTVASRSLNSNSWTYRVLPSRIGWDSHNYITMIVDSTNQLHVSGNMHGVPLIYFRTEKSGDIHSLKQWSMTGERENRVTYPKFLKDHEGKLVFTYRDGGSGNGVRLYNHYDTGTQTWTRLLDEPLFDGEGQRNAYPLGPIHGPDGWFHVVWVWRDTPDCATNNNLSYVRSRDLVHWESFRGEQVSLPIRIGMRKLQIDPIPSGGGIINGCEKLFIDANNRPVVTYHKSDGKGHMQIYAARAQGEQWIRHVLTDWKKSVAFSGKGSMGFIGIQISGLRRLEPGVLTMTYHHRDYGRGRLFLDEDTLRPLNRSIVVSPTIPADLNVLESSFPGMEIQRVEDSHESGDEHLRYILQWETLGRNHDRPRKPPFPKPSMLRLHTLRLVPND